VKIPSWALPLLVLALFAGGVLALRGAGVWRGRERSLPPIELAPPPTEPGPGGMPM
jgi:hypothetical protein